MIEVIQIFKRAALVINYFGPKDTGKSMSFQAMTKKLLKSI